MKEAKFSSNFFVSVTILLLIEITIVLAIYAAT
jgi:hypothetical protein